MKLEEFYTNYLQFPQICTDSRKVTPGCLYFALRGEHFDGNQFAADALSKGCRYSIVDDPTVVAGPDYFLVPDVLVFLQDLARFHRQKLKIPVIGLTGTNGKTTTKELIFGVLKNHFRTIATQGNLNNHIGVPLTILSATPETEIIVVEMGANHPGEIAFLSEIARPTIGLITNIGMAHLEGFGSLEGVTRTKNELYQWIMSTGGKMLVNANDPILVSLVGEYPCLFYGIGNGFGVNGSLSNNGNYLVLDWYTGNDSVIHRINTRLSGSYNAANILAAVSIGVLLGLTPDQIGQGIGSYEPANMRSQWIETGKNTLFLDAYNANPSSMAVAIRSFSEYNLSHPVVILGDMFELGDQAPQEHKVILEIVRQCAFEKVFFTGAEFCRYSGMYPFDFFPDIGSLIAFINRDPLSGFTILIKGSRGMQLERLVNYL